jgi:lipopolysaccharide export system permease protein
MKRIGWIISRYLLSSILPYFAFAWLLLSVILFVQQASRYSDIFFNANIPSSLIWQLTVALIPNVIAFTCPMAMLVGTIIGLAKMQTDSELVAIRASGVGNIQIAVPIMLLGVMLSAFAFVVNLYGVPLAASLVRNVALQTAIKKLESPLEPGVFNTEVAGYTIYVKGGDLETGRWKNIFIYSEDATNRSLRLITSQRGRIDTTADASELVLEDASVSTLPMDPGQGKYVTETIGEVRFAIKTKRGELVSKLSRHDAMPDELGLRELSDYAAAAQDTRERVEAGIIWQRRILLSITPFIFCILGTVLILRFNRGGRGRAIGLSFGVLVGFYLFAFLGEQLARTGQINVTVAGLIPLAASAAVILWLTYARRFDILPRIRDSITSKIGRVRTSTAKLGASDIFVDLTTGLRDFDLLRGLLRNFILTLAFLAAIFLIFTAFELWKFAGAFEGGVVLLIKYLFYLLPFVYLQIAPSAAMIATIATYVIKSRQNEIVTWTSAGQSVYRLLLPCFLLMVVIGVLNFAIQETIGPKANRLQEETRQLIRNVGVAKDDHGKYWIANEKRIYSFNLPSASDNDKRDGCLLNCVRDLSVYEFDNKGTELQSVYRSKTAVWEKGTVTLLDDVERDSITSGKIEPAVIKGTDLAEPVNPFQGLRAKPSQLTVGELKQQIAATDYETEQRNLAVALDKKYATLALPFVIALFTAPFSLSLSRKGKVLTVGYAVGLWLLFTGAGNVFDQFGYSGYLPSSLAVWSPLAIFSLFGIYLLSKVRT